MRYSVRLRGFRLPPRPTDLSLPGEAAPLNRKGAGRGGAPALPPRWIAPSACLRAEKDKGFSQSATRPLPRSGTGTAPVAAVTGGARGDSKEVSSGGPRPRLPGCHLGSPGGREGRALGTTGRRILGNLLLGL